MHEINIVLQPKGSKICGHCCLAMVLSDTVETIISLIGHNKGTYTKELVSVLNSKGYEVPKRLTIIKGKEFPQFCILKVQWKTWHSHWVLFKDGIVYCPTYGKYTLNTYKNMISEIGKITSFLKIEKV